MPTSEPKRWDGAYAAHLGMTAEHTEPGLARTRVTVQPFHLHGGGVMHGGLLVTLADSAMSRSLMMMIEPGQSTTTIEMKVNFMRPAMLGEEIVAEAKVVQKGKSIAVVEAEVRNMATGKVLLKGLCTCMILNAPQGKGKEKATSTS